MLFFEVGVEFGVEAGARLVGIQVRQAVALHFRCLPGPSPLEVNYTAGEGLTGPVVLELIQML